MDEAVAGLSGMNRKELVELFLRCDPPSDARELAFEDGEKREEDGGGCWVYDGYLLDNGPILVSERRDSQSYDVPPFTIKLFDLFVSRPSHEYSYFLRPA